MKYIIAICFIAICLLAIASIPAAQAPKAAAPAHPLLQDVNEFDKSGTPGALSLWGDAQALIAGEYRGRIMPVVATSRAGKGRVLALGHPGYLGKAQEGSGRWHLLTNFLRERLKNQDNPKVICGAKEIKNICDKMGWGLIDGGSQWHTHLERGHVVVLSPAAAGTKAQKKALQSFVKKGGYLAIAFAGWIYTHHWAKGKSLTRDCWVNQTLAPYGIAYSDHYIDKVIAPTDQRASKDHLAFLNADRCFASIKELIKPGIRSDKTNRGQAFKNLGRVCADAMRYSPLEGNGFAARVKSQLPDTPSLSQQRPVGFGTPLKRLAVILWQRLNSLKSIEERSAAPNVASFPGAIPAKAKRSDTYFDVDLSKPGWLSTGYYAPPGEVVTLTIPKEAQSLGLKWRIGAHKDKLYGKRDTWYRYPDISQSHEITGVAIKANNPFGGHLYIENPKARKGVKLSFGVINAVKAPYYLLGKTSAEDWKTIRDFPAPWAELACNDVTLTLPSKLIRKLDDPEKLMKFWQKTRGYYAELSGKPLQARTERMVVDVQISAGYMHAGYPIMMQTYQAADKVLVDLEKLSKTPRASAWGLWHELGHNHQEKWWTYSNTTEVTVNLFSLYVCERITGKSFVMKHRDAEKRLEAYFKDKLTWKDWGKKPFSGLLFYELVIEEFGWETIKRTLASYLESKGHQLPKTDLEKRSQWLTRLSKQCGKNLAPYFDAFGVEVAASARDEIKKLPVWMPNRVSNLLAKYPR